MVLLILIALAIVSLSTITLRSDNSASETEIARANARLGLMLAVNQLQRTMGPDQRTTAPADLKSPSAANRKWVGVYGNQQVADYSHKPSEIPSAPYEPVLLNWLVSGNQSVTYTASTNPTNFGQITSPPSSILFSPDDAVSLADNPTIKSEKAALLVSDGSTIETQDFVTAPIVTVSNSNGVTRGGYAYWTADESMKARVDLRENFRQQTTSSEIDEGKIHSFMVAQRLGIEMLSRDGTNTTEIGDDYDPSNEDIAKVLSTSQLPLLSESLKADETLKHRFHDITAYSKSVISDSYAGGLKQDMTAIIYGGHGPSNDSPIFTPSSESEFGLPTWGHIRSWANLTAPLTTPPPIMPTSAVRPYTANQTRFGPVILLSQLAWGLETDPNTPNSLRVVMYPALILWNPYTVGIPATNFELGFRYIPGQAGNDVMNVQMRSNSVDWTDLGSCNLSGGNSTMTTGNGFFRFMVEGSEIPAGESHIYLAEFPTTNQFVSGETKLVRAPDTSPIGYLSRPVSTNTSFAYDPTTFTSASNPDAELSVRLDSPLGTAQGMTNGNLAEVVLTDPNELQNGYDQDTPVYQALLDMNFFPDSSDVNVASVISTLKPLSAAGSGSGPMYMTRSTIMMEARGNPASSWNVVGAMNSNTRGERNRWIANQNPIAPYVKRTANERDLRGGAFSHGSVFSGSNDQSARRMLGNSRVHNHLAGVGGSPGSPITSSEARQAPLIDILSDESPLISIGQLQHAQLDPYAFGVTYTFGNASAHVNIPRNEHFKTSQVAQPGNTPTTYTDSLYDMSWHANRAIWDRYFLSSAQPTLSQSDIDNNLPLPNARIQYITTNSENPKVEDIRPTNASALLEAAANLMISGGFNINSTSVDAWRAILTGTNKLTVPSSVAHPQYSSEPLNTMMPRFSRDSRLTDSADDEGITNMWSNTVPRKNLYRGNRELVLFGEVGMTGESASDAQDRLYEVADELAKKIVAEIRLRGPFLSVSNFVNRQLTTDDEGIRGTLQAALDKMDNNHVNPTNSYDQIGGILTDNSIPNWDLEHYLGVPSNEAASGSKYKMAMAPKFLTQADILSTIGSSLFTRSDTFKVRSYGEAVDPNGNVTARAWCEAIVQRTPNYLDIADSASTTPADLTVETNKEFGRRFKITSFRWLTKEEI